MAYELTSLPTILRDAGCRVVEQAGWQDRGRGHMGSVAGVMVHHTGGSTHGNVPSLDVIVNGRLPPDPKPLPGPLSQLLQGRDGTFYVIAAGRCNHAGAGFWQGVTDGNGRFIGIEAENAGTKLDAWPDVQMNDLVKGTAALLKEFKCNPIMAVGHREYALPAGRKDDPLFDMNAFRAHVTAVINGTPTPPMPKPIDPAHAMLKLGDHGESVKFLQMLLHMTTVDGAFGPNTEKAVKQFQSSHSLVADGQVGPKTWAVLLK